MRTRIIITVVAALLAGSVAIAVATNSDNPGQGTTLTFYAKATQQVAGPPPIGEWVSVAWDVHELSGTAETPAPVDDPIGRMAGTCTPLTETEGTCVGWVDLDGRGLLTLALQTGPDPFVVTGGTGEFAGAAGVGEEPRVPGTANDRVVTLELSGFNRP